MLLRCISPTIVNRKYRFCLFHDRLFVTLEGRRHSRYKKCFDDLQRNVRVLATLLRFGGRCRFFMKAILFCMFYATSPTRQKRSPSSIPNIWSGDSFFLMFFVSISLLVAWGGSRDPPSSLSSHATVSSLPPCRASWISTWPSERHLLLVFEWISCQL